MKRLPDMIATGLVPIAAAVQECGLLESLAAPKRAAEHAAALGLDPRATELVLDVLVQIGHCERDDDGRYRRRRTMDSPAWDHLATMLRTGEVLPAIDRREARPKVYEAAVDLLGDRFARSARELATRLPEARQILDVGAGSGVWSLSMAERWPAARVTAIDYPEVLDRFTARADHLGLTDRVDTLAGDYFRAPIPEADRVVLANVLHLETEEDAGALIQRYAAALAPEGDLVIIDALGQGTPERDLMRACYALHLGLRTEKGGVHPTDALIASCERAGLSDCRLELLDDTLAGMGALVARRG